MANDGNNIQESWDRAAFCFGTAKILDKKLKWIVFFNKIVKFVGLVIPLSIGSVVVAFGTNISLLPILLLILGILGTFQLIISLWALVDGWDNKIESYSGAKSKNQYYSDIFCEIAKCFNEDKKVYSKLFNDTILSDNLQRENDNRINMSDKDRRYGMRYALFQFNRKCASCGKIPDINNPSNCNVCGK